MRLNRRPAPDIYLETVAITGDSAEPRIGGNRPAIEYAVKMRESAQSALLDSARAARCAAIHAGADGYLLKDMEPEDLLTVIDEALNGRTVIGERLNGLLARAIREEATAIQRDTAALTDREREILQGLAQGLSNKLIARDLDITEATVKVHVKNLLKRLGFRSPLEAAVWAVGRGIKRPV